VHETELDIQPADSAGTYALSGEIDLHTATRIAEISTRPHATIILDFSHVTFIDSIGVWALVNLARGLDGGALVIRNASGSVRQTLDLVDLADAPGIVVE
jgi:anti-anti-sigma factor